MKKLTLATLAGCVALSVATGLPSLAAPSSHAPRQTLAGPLGGYSNVVVIYQENHSFDNLYGMWGKVNGERVNGLSEVQQVAQNGKTYDCLLQNDVNLTAPSPLPATCTDTTTGTPFVSHFVNHTFVIDDYIAATDKTCPPDAPAPYHPFGWAKDEPGAVSGGCTRDQVHRFYQEQYQLDGGKQDRYVTGSDAVGLTMGVYDTTQLPIYQYLHSAQAPNYVLADNFFQAAYGGSFLNHQFLISGRAPLDASNGALGAKYSVLDSNGMPTSYPLYKATVTGLVDGQLTQKCADGGNDYSKACGSYAVNTVQSTSIPFGGGAKIAPIDDRQFPNIGDAMNAKGITWNWYSGGWDDAVAGRPGTNFQYHHQPFNYFADYQAGGAQRSHLQDETKFFAAAQNGTLPQVSFVKPYGTENEHPGYASATDGSNHLVDLVKAITEGPQGKDTLIVITYDEFGGSFDHVAPTSLDAFGDGTRIPALFISAGMQHSGVDHTRYDTASIIRTIEDQWGLGRLGAGSRDALVDNLANVVTIGGKMPATSKKWEKGVQR